MGGCSGWGSCRARGSLLRLLRACRGAGRRPQPWQWCSDALAVYPAAETQSMHFMPRYGLEMLTWCMRALCNVCHCRLPCDVRRVDVQACDLASRLRVWDPTQGHPLGHELWRRPRAQHCAHPRAAGQGGHSAGGKKGPSGNMSRPDQEGPTRSLRSRPNLTDQLPSRLVVFDHRCPTSMQRQQHCDR